MQGIFEWVNGIFSFITPVSDFLWEFSTNFDWYAKIPVLGSFSLAIILLLGAGIFFTIKLGFMQITHFKRGIKIMTAKRHVKTGISPLAAFMLSSAMRVGPGNIIGVTGAIALGGPGALFRIWVSAFFGMAVAYVNIPIVFIGARYVFRATRHYKKGDKTPFTSKTIGRKDLAYWDEKAKNQEE